MKWMLFTVNEWEWMIFRVHKQDQMIFTVHAWEQVILWYALFDNLMRNDQEWTGSIFHDC